MASAVRVTRTARSAAVMPTGQFGARVAAIVAAQYQDCAVVPDGAVDEAFSAPARVVVAAMWRPSPALCERADVLSFSAGRAWLPVTLDQFAIHIGPVVVPPAGPCYRCCAWRRAQHDRHHARTAALHEAFDRDRSCGPAGYLPHHARLAGGIAMSLADAVLGPAGGETAVAMQATVSLTDYAVSTSRVLACHDCGRCRAGREPVDGGRLLRLVASVRG